MRMYVANTTNKVHDFIYRLPETPTPRMQRIEMGSQIAISSDLSTKEIDSIIEQHRPYGMVCVDEVDRTKPFIGLCYSLGKPVSLDKVRRALEHNQKVLTERGAEIRKESAVAVNNAIEQQAPGIKALELSVVEEETKKNPNPTIAEGVRVSRNEPSTPPGRKGSRRASAGA